MINATTLNQDGTGALACIRRGNFASIAANQAGRITRTNTALLRWYADDAGVVLTGTGSVPDIRNGLYRTLLTKDNTGGDIRVHSLMGQIKAYDAKWNDEVVSAVHGRIELVRSASTMTLGGNGVTAAVMGIPSVSGAVTVNTSHVLAGVAAISDFRATLTQTGKVAGFYVGAYDTTNWSDATARTTWGYGLLIADNAAATGIHIGICTTAFAFGAVGRIINSSGTTTGAAITINPATTGAGLKIHTHQNVNNSGGTYDYTFINEFKGEFVSTSGTMYGVGAIYNLETSSGAMSAMYGQAILTAGKTLSGTSATGSWISGGLFSCDLKGTSVLNGTAVLALGLYAEVVSAIDSTLTACKHAAAICGSGKMLVKPTSGECSLVYLVQAAGATCVNQAIYIEGGATVDAFLTIDVAASGKAIETSVVNIGGGTANTAHALHIKIGATNGYIPVYNNANFTA